MWQKISLAVTFSVVAGLVSAGPADVRQQPPAPPSPPVPPVVQSVPVPPVIPPVPVLPEFSFDIDTLPFDLAGLKLEAVAASVNAGMAGAFDALSAGLAAPDFPAQADQVRADRRSFSQGVEYTRGTEALDAGRYERALEAFDRAISRGGARTDGAMYWKAYALNRLGRRDKATRTIDDLLKKFPSSRWTNDAKALLIDVRQASGQPVPPGKADDEELKLMALNALMQSDPDKAMPLLEKTLTGSEPPRVRERALFVLAQSGSPRAREVLGRVARGQGNPDVQMKAVRYLGLFGGAESRQILSDVYVANPDEDVRRQILRAFMLAGDKQRLVATARTETHADLRAEAVRQLGMLGAREELSDLYRRELSAEVRKEVLQSLFMAGDSDRLAAIARAEADVALRRTAVRDMGMIGKGRTGEALVEIYRAEKDASVKKAAIQALFIQQNAGALVQLARQETDPELKKDIVSKLALIKSSETTDYMMEILKK